MGFSCIDVYGGIAEGRMGLICTKREREIDGEVDEKHIRQRRRLHGLALALLDTTLMMTSQIFFL